MISGYSPSLDIQELIKWQIQGDISDRLRHHRFESHGSPGFSQYAREAAELLTQYGGRNLMVDMKPVAWKDLGSRPAWSSRSFRMPAW